MRPRGKRVVAGSGDAIAAPRGNCGLTWDMTARKLLPASRFCRSKVASRMRCRRSCAMTWVCCSAKYTWSRMSSASCRSASCGRAVVSSIAAARPAARRTHCTCRRRRCCTASTSSVWLLAAESRTGERAAEPTAPPAADCASGVGSAPRRRKGCAVNTRVRGIVGAPLALRNSAGSGTREQV